ncbi:hypothetical protein ACT3SP_01255 [Brachybacterium sp. AOP43-C2-M15]|uniref:hypothetical protein n=1 Tax=Brachybacterium sp. AOP43-C2-M15 TaxID=3457661 RepID=UPI004033AAA1
MGSGRRQNSHGDLAYTDPSSVDSSCYDSAIDAGARSWFKEEAVNLLHIARHDTLLLDRHQVPWVELRTDHPGRIVYEDPVQVVAVPFVHEEHRPLRAAPPA